MKQVCELSRMQETWAEIRLTDKCMQVMWIRRVIKDMITDNGRGGRYHGGGYYEYHEDGSKNIWPKTKDFVLQRLSNQ
jgi:3-hydroxyacyl-CoA dehydrogenase/enoyl-CoA hydratase/3-hydroxybutyryl-CoA epimerase